MKTPTLLRTVLFCLAGFAATTAVAADEFSHSYIALIDVIKDTGGKQLFTAGDTAVTVLRTLDQPHYMFSKSVWLYRNFPAPPKGDAGMHLCDSLIISFGPGNKPSDQKVSVIALANAAGVKKIEKSLKQNPRYLEDLQTGY